MVLIYSVVSLNCTNGTKSLKVSYLACDFLRIPYFWLVI